MKVKAPPKYNKHLKLVNHIFSDKNETSNFISQTISKNSSKKTLSPKFIAYKMHKKRNFLISHLKSKNVIMIPLHYMNCNSLLTILTILPQAKIKFTIKFLKHLPRKSKECLLLIFNKFWDQKDQKGGTDQDMKAGIQKARVAFIKLKII